MNEEQLTKAAIVIIGTVAYAVSGYMQKVRKDETVVFEPVKMGKTVVVGVVAGGVILLQDVSEVEVAIGIAVPIVDEILNNYIGGTTAEAVR